MNGQRQAARVLLGYRGLDLPQPAYQRVSVFKAGHQLFLQRVRQHLLQRLLVPDDKVFHLDVFDVRRVGVKAFGRPLQLALGLQVAVSLHQFLVFQHLAETLGIGHHLLADRPQAVGRRHVFAAGDEQSAAGVDMEIISRPAALARLLQAAGGDRCREIGFVRTLVVREAHVAVDPEQRFLRIAAGDRRIELADLGDQAHHQFQELCPQDIVARLVHDKPGPVVILRQLGEVLGQIAYVHYRISFMRVIRILFWLALHRRPLADNGFYRGFLGLAQYRQLGFAAGLQLGDQVGHVGAVGDRLAFDRHQDVARFQAGLVGRAVLDHAGDDGAGAAVQAEALGQFGRDVLRFDADITAHHVAGIDDRFHHGLGGRHRHGETDPERTAGARIDRGVDADQVAVGVDQGAAGIAGVDRSIGLDEVLELVDAEMAATQRRNDPHGHRLADPERIADRQHDVADAGLVSAAQRHRRQVRQLDLDHGQVGFRIGADYLGSSGAAVGQRHFDFVGGFHHMVIGQDITLGADDDARAQAGLLVIGIVAAVAEELPQQRIFRHVGGDRLGVLAGEHVHHRRHGALRSLAVGTRRRRARRGFLQRHLGGGDMQRRTGQGAV
ncbi:hypothetical protein CFU_0527 [Collimonas fungivorans Ter331]|uniref:Uncharacterized protein n=1 Tax=Collimonas fungivorans (strain Ter331) TaxID=1005048 RepID=G0AHT6_COLFT|nr:hypothetical protein CFU_0527 [Collimonas fungivorans Ter331]